MPRQKQVQPTIDECRKAYWNACERYQTARTDPYSTWTQINDAATDVSTARAVWIRRCAATLRDPAAPAMRRNRAAELVAHETGEPVEWVLNRAKRA